MNKSAMVCATRMPCFYTSVQRLCKVQSASTLKVVPSAFRLLLSAASLRELQNKQRHVTAINRRVEPTVHPFAAYSVCVLVCDRVAWGCTRHPTKNFLPTRPDTENLVSTVLHIHVRC